MHLVSELACGILGAELGTAEFYRRGSSTHIPYYADFEGNGSVTPTGAVDLDANGGGVFYVNETTRVVVRDATGTTVREFVSASAAASVEVVSQSFTGTDYQTGATEASKPLALSAALDALYTSAGARDFNVLYGGTAISLQSLAAKVGTLFFNVKDPAYGAVGNGSTDDTAAIQAALDAAQTAGGGIVFFPKGTYPIGSALTVAAGVSLLGAGPGASVIALNVDAGSGMLSFAASALGQSVDSLGFVPSVATSRASILTNNGTRLTVRNCNFGSSTYSGSLSCGHANTTIDIDNCTFTTSGTAISASAGRFRASWCKFTLTSTYASTLINGPAAVEENIVVEYCTIDASAMAAGSGTLFAFGTTAGGRAILLGNICGNPAGGTLALSVGPGINNNGADCVLELGNRWGSAITRSALYGAQALASTYTGSFFLERERRRGYVADDGAAVTVNTTVYSSYEIVRTNNGAQTVTLDGPGPVNCLFTLVYHNNQGGAGGTITMAGNVKGLTSFSVNATSVSYYTFMSVHRGTSKYWVLVGPGLVNQTP